MTSCLHRYNTMNKIEKYYKLFELAIKLCNHHLIIYK